MGWWLFQRPKRHDHASAGPDGHARRPTAQPMIMGKWLL
jgi:hypothetical protein